MTGFGKTEEPPFGTKTAKQGEWYYYSLYGDRTAYFGRFRNRDRDEAVIYFDRAPVHIFDDKGALWVIKDGEVGIQLPHLREFFPAKQEDVERFVETMNYLRNYWGNWVFISNKEREHAIGRVCRVFPTAVHLMPYFSGLLKDVVTEGKEKIVLLDSLSSIEVITEKALQEYLSAPKGRKNKKE